jgi:hypothetical protein
MNMRLEEYSMMHQQQVAKNKKGFPKLKDPPKIQKPGMSNTGLALVASHRDM